MQDKQNTFRSLKRKENDLQLSQNEMTKNLKGQKAKYMLKKMQNGCVKSLGGQRWTKHLQVKYVALLLTPGLSIDTYRKGLNTKLPMANHCCQFTIEFWSMRGSLSYV